MTRERILQSPAYWISKIQIALYNCAEKFMSANSMNRSQLAAHLGVSKGYVSQLLNGDYDHKLSKLVELALSFGFVPTIEFKPIGEVMKTDRAASSSMSVLAQSGESVSPTRFTPVSSSPRILRISVSDADRDYPPITSPFEKVSA